METRKARGRSYSRRDLEEFSDNERASTVIGFETVTDAQENDDEPYLSRTCRQKFRLKASLRGDTIIGDSRNKRFYSISLKNLKELNDKANNYSVKREKLKT